VNIAVPAEGTDLDAPTSPLFGRAPFYVLVDPETMRLKALANPEQRALRGAGFETPKLLAGREARAVVARSVGPNAFKALSDLALPVYLSTGETVREAVEAYASGQLQLAEGANARTHSERTRVEWTGRGFW
jgi:predicted Fe-Mo cluster-binding NifX family protein